MTDRELLAQYYPTAVDLETVRTLALAQPGHGLDRGLVDVVALLLGGVLERDLDAIADDIVCVVLQFDDLVRVVRERLDVQQAYREKQHAAPAAEPKRAATDIINALHAVMRPRLAKERAL